MEEMELFLGAGKSYFEAMMCPELLEHAANNLEGETTVVKKSRKAHEVHACTQVPDIAIPRSYKWQSGRASAPELVRFSKGQMCVISLASLAGGVRNVAFVAMNGWRRPVRPW